MCLSVWLYFIERKNVVNKNGYNASIYMHFTALIRTDPDRALFCPFVRAQWVDMLDKREMQGTRDYLPMLFAFQLVQFFLYSWAFTQISVC